MTNKLARNFTLALFAALASLSISALAETHRWTSTPAAEGNIYSIALNEEAATLSCKIEMTNGDTVAHVEARVQDFGKPHTWAVQRTVVTTLEGHVVYGRSASILYSEGETYPIPSVVDLLPGITFGFKSLREAESGSETI